MVAKENQFGSHWVQWEIIPLGGMWAVVVGIIEDDNSHERKIRIAKGKIKGSVKRDLGVLKVIPNDEKDPITQVNRLNIKDKGDWEQIKKLGDKFFDILEKGAVKK